MALPCSTKPMGLLLMFILKRMAVAATTDFRIRWTSGQTNDLTAFMFTPLSSITFFQEILLLLRPLKYTDGAWSRRRHKQKSIQKPFTGTSGTDFYPVSVSDLILAPDRSKWYFTLDYQSEADAPGKAELCELPKDGGTRAVRKTYDQPALRPTLTCSKSETGISTSKADGSGSLSQTHQTTMPCQMMNGTIQTPAAI